MIHNQIAQKLLRDQLLMIKNIPNPEMLHNNLKALSDLHDDVMPRMQGVVSSHPRMQGGGYPSQYVLTGSNVGSYEPSTLSVGGGINPLSKIPNHLVEEGIQGGSLRRKRGRPRKEQGGNIFDTLGSVAKTVAPIAIPLMMGLGMEKKKRGRPSKKGGMLNAPPTVTSREIVNEMPSRKVKKGVKGGNFLDTLKYVGKTVGKDVLLPVGTDMAKTALKSYLTTGAGIRKRKTQPRQKAGDFLSTLKSIGNYIKPVAEKIGKDVILPVATDVGKDALKSYLTTPKGAGLKRSERAKLVKRIMKEKGLNLPQASSYIKQHNLTY
jgi:hypothetical protein